MSVFVFIFILAIKIVNNLVDRGQGLVEKPILISKSEIPTIDRDNIKKKKKTIPVTKYLTPILITICNSLLTYNL